MDRHDIVNRIDYMIACIGAFAQKFRLSNMQAYSYLRRFSAIDFLIEFYEAEHTLSIDDAVDDIRQICKRNGGRL